MAALLKKHSHPKLLCSPTAYPSPQIFHCFLSFWVLWFKGCFYHLESMLHHLENRYPADSTSAEMCYIALPRHDAMKSPFLSLFQTNLCNHRSRLLKFTPWFVAAHWMFSRLQTCCCKGTVKLLMFEKQQGFTSLMEEIQICSPKLGTVVCHISYNLVRPAGVTTLPHV